jgi:hypothetical protein
LLVVALPYRFINQVLLVLIGLRMGTPKSKFPAARLNEQELKVGRPRMAVISSRRTGPYFRMTIAVQAIKP